MAVCIDKAVYTYPLEHYEYWKQFLGKEYLDAGSFGENLTTQCFLDIEVFMGDYWQFDTALLMAYSPACLVPNWGCASTIRP